MAELLWRLVLKVNARAVFLLTLLALCIVLVMLLHRGARQGADLRMSGHSVSASNGGLLPKRAGMQAVPAEEIEDPFTSAFLVAWLDLETSRLREREASRAKQALEVAPKPAPAKPKVAPAPKRQVPKWVGVTYQGMVSRTDGSRVALVNEVAGGKLYTLKVGDVLLGGRVTEIAAERVVLAVGDDADLPLRVGVVSRVPKE